MTATASVQLSQNRMNNYEGLLLGGLTAGTLDISAAFIENNLAGRASTGVLQAIASGLLGSSAFRGGLETAVLGLLLHFVIALVAATIYYVTSRRVPYLNEYAIFSGLLYGAIVYLTMTFLVVPLSAAPFKLTNGAASVVTGVIIHMLCIGLPVALAARTSRPLR